MGIIVISGSCWKSHDVPSIPLPSLLRTLQSLDSFSSSISLLKESSNELEKLHRVAKKRTNKPTEESMFYSHLLLSKKGALGTVWVAAHCHKRLKKNQVKQTDISSSVEKILLDEVPVVTYRILAYLLLGVVRIYSKKVEYLFHDCHEVLSKLHEFKISKRARDVSISVTRAQKRAIAWPKRFELDAFDVEVSEDQELGGLCSGNVKSREELMLADGRINDGSSDGFRYKGKTLYSEAYSTASTPPRDVLSPHDTDPDSFGSPFHNMNDSGTNLDLFRGTLFPLEDHLDPMVLDDTEKQQIDDSVTTPLHNVIDSITSFEKLHELRPSVQLDEPDDLNVLVNKEHPVDGMNSLEVINAESKECQRNYPVSISVDVTPDSKLPEGGVVTPEVGNVKTPAPKERAKILKKRKMLFDETTVLANKVYKSWISDPSNLICKRRTAPHTILHALRTRKLSSMSQSILEPLIPHISINLDSFESKRKIYKEPVEPVELPSIQDVANSSVMLSSREQIPLASTAPVSHLTLLISNETGAVADSDILEPELSLEILENRPASSGGKELEMMLRDEEADSPGEDSREKNKYATRTRMTGRYLYKNFLHKKRQRQDEVVDLSEILRQKTKKESARLFYEILVLKMENCIDVRQDSPYGDILLLESSKLKQIYESG